MKFKVLLFLLTLTYLTSSCSKKYNLPESQNTQKFKGKYSEYLEDEKELSSWYHYVTSVNNNKEYVLRIFHPEKKQVTSLTTYLSNKFNIRNGEYKSWYDDGDLRSTGMYEKDKKSGIWKYYQIGNNFLSSKGEYQNGKEIGIWEYFDSKGRLSSKISYNNGIKDGEFITYDSLGSVVNSGLYKNDEITSQKNTEINESLLEEFPIMFECDDSQNFKSEKDCSDRKMLEFIYKNIKYPDDARMYGVEGTAITSFYIDKNGNVKGVKVVSGLCESIQKECKRIVESMPKWHKPGKLNGEIVKVSFNLPIKFRLE